ncbi:hypothetical protein Pmani_001814 [Petrolisthes manimaculis]|nr:hypothetical protein Pmani_008268 [Petrolisthes manimaculis]KAK4327036.1 hypothetical protein Pmani_002484 [Petrolisthes manimaculis]KAK4327773.1 hypothetical protein Pmani_001814 [Petrolisthes manimaculis]
MEAGLVSYWIDDVIADRVRETRRQQTHTEDDNISISTQERDGNQVVLRLTHLQGAFLMLILGHGIGCVAFILEYIFRGPN